MWLLQVFMWSMTAQLAHFFIELQAVIRYFIRLLTVSHSGLFFRAWRLSLVHTATSIQFIFPRVNATYAYAVPSPNPRSSSVCWVWSKVTLHYISSTSCGILYTQFILKVFFSNDVLFTMEAKVEIKRTNKQTKKKTRVDPKFKITTGPAEV